MFHAPDDGKTYHVGGKRERPATRSHHVLRSGRRGLSLEADGSLDRDGSESGYVGRVRTVPKDSCCVPASPYVHILSRLQQSEDNTSRQCDRGVVLQDGVPPCRAIESASPSVGVRSCYLFRIDRCSVAATRHFRSNRRAHRQNTTKDQYRPAGPRSVLTMHLPGHG